MLTVYTNICLISYFIYAKIILFGNNIQMEVENMITSVSVVGVYVRDEQAALQFYTEVLGFVKHSDFHGARRTSSPLAHRHPKRSAAIGDYPA